MWSRNKINSVLATILFYFCSKRPHMYSNATDAKTFLKQLFILFLLYMCGRLEQK